MSIACKGKSIILVVVRVKSYIRGCAESRVRVRGGGGAHNARDCQALGGSFVPTIAFKRSNTSSGSSMRSLTT